MTNSLSAKGVVVKTGLIAAAAALAVAPAFALAATYAYVDQTGDVKTVEAANPNTAIMTAPNIDEHSGVMLLVNPNDSVVGDNVQSV